MSLGICVYDFLLGTCLGVELEGHSLSEYCQKAFQRCCTVYTCVSNLCEFHFLYILTSL